MALHEHEEERPVSCAAEAPTRLRASWQVWSERLVRWTLAGLFLWAGVVKLSDPDAFAVLIDAFDILPYRALKPVAIALPILEILAAIGLLTGRRAALHLVTGLLALFLVVLLYGIYMELDVDCGCFGPTDPEWRAGHGLKPALRRDLVMAAGIVWLYWRAWWERRGERKARVSAP